MSRLVNIESNEFWQILFDEAYVEGNQAVRIESELNKISIKEDEVKNNIIYEFITELLDWEPKDESYKNLKDVCYEIAEKLSKNKENEEELEK